MNLGEVGPPTAEVLAAAAAAAILWRAGRLQAGRWRRGFWWFAVAAALECVHVVIAAAVPPPAAPMVSFADLTGLLQLPALAAGLADLASPEAPGPDAHAQRRTRRSVAALCADLADGYVLAAGLFLVGWVTLFGRSFASAGVDPATFAESLLRPLADLVFLGATLGLAARAGQRGVPAYLALVAMTVHDGLTVGARLAATRPGAAALVTQLASLALLALIPAAARQWPSRAWRPAGQAQVTIAAGIAVAGGLAVAVGWAVTGRAPAPVVVLVLSPAVAVLALRLVGLARRADSWARVWQESGREFRQLAERTSDVVLLCDSEGVVRYASRAVADHGYTPDRLRGVRLMDLLHPEDSAPGTTVVRDALGRPGQRPGPYTCRVRAADGTWRHVEATISRYRNPGSRDQLLVTARALSAQVALRRQVTHLTFHDGLTGLPNRAYIEQRAREVLGRGPAATVAGAVILDVDDFASCNDTVGRAAGDLLLSQIARRLRLAGSPQDTVARWGGDEFAVLVEEASTVDELIECARRLALSLASSPFRVEDVEVGLTASVGVAVGDGSPAGRVWRHAEAAMTSAKEAGGDRLELYAGPDAAASGCLGPDGGADTAAGTPAA